MSFLPGDSQYSHDRVEDNVREEHDSFNEDQEQTNCEVAAAILSSTEEVVVQYAGACSFPLVQPKDNENDDADDECGKYTSIGPAIKTASKVETHQ